MLAALCKGIGGGISSVHLVVVVVVVLLALLPRLWSGPRLCWQARSRAVS